MRFQCYSRTIFLTSYNLETFSEVIFLISDLENMSLEEFQNLATNHPDELSQMFSTPEEARDFVNQLSQRMNSQQ